MSHKCMCHLCVMYVCDDKDEITDFSHALTNTAIELHPSSLKPYIYLLN